MTSADRDFLLKTSLTEMVNSELADQLTGRSDSRRVLEGLSRAAFSPSIPIASALSIAQQIENGQALSIYWKRNTLR
jgi:hypothetical protein